MHIVSISYDRFPSPKGAGRHIAETAKALADAFGRVDLVTVAPMESERHAASFSWPGVVHHPLPVEGSNMIERVLNFQAHLSAWLRGRFVDVVHVRSIFEGYPIALHKDRYCRRLVYEVNGLPSVELKYTYPDVVDDQELLRKLTHQENVCLQAADLVVVVSRTTAQYLAARGTPEHKIRLVPNGVDLDLFPYHPPRPWTNADGEDREVRWLYSGTLSSWQGAGLAVEALALYRRDHPARLTLIGPSRPAQRRGLLDLAWRLGAAESVEILDPASQSELAELHAQCDAALAPLRANDRNLEQGCCPLKVLEAMACGVPVVASDLPVVRELAEPDVHAVLVRPGSAKALKDAMLRLRGDPSFAHAISSEARRRIVESFTWRRSAQRLAQAYRERIFWTAAHE